MSSLSSNSAAGDPFDVLRGAGAGGRNPRDWRDNEETTTTMMSFKSASLSFLNPPISHTNRSYNTFNYLPNEGPLGTPLPNIESLSAEEQENMLIQEVLFILGGLESCLISVHHVPPNKVQFTIDSRIEQSLQDLAIQIAQLGSHYYIVTRFIENWKQFDNGRVNHALCAAIRDSIKDYFILLAQMETIHEQGVLTLQKLWFYLQPTVQTFCVLRSIASEIEDKCYKGGNILSLLHAKALSMVGDQFCQSTCCTLAEKASRPYFDTLATWIHKGIIDDPFSEFFVIDNDKREGLIKNSDDDYWEKRYTVVNERCPTFLQKLMSEILKTGKYLNVIRQCGRDVSTCMISGKISYSIHERVYFDAIEKAYNFASKTLLDMLLNEYDLMRRLESVKHYLLMDQGDFIVQFLDLAEVELCKKMDDINEVRLSSLLELALRTSSSATDPYKDSVRVELIPYSIDNQMRKIISIETPMEKRDPFEEDFMENYMISGFESFSFSYEVEWPISLVLNSRALMCYQMIFRHLFYCKHVERELCKVWLSGKSSKGISTLTAEKVFAFNLRQKMLNFVQNIQYYIAFEVVEPVWHVFLNTMSRVTNVDQVMDCHLNLVNSILDDSMLTNPDLLERMASLLSLCLRFTEKMIGKPDNKINISALSKSSKKKVESMNNEFTSELVNFLGDISRVMHSPNQSSKVINIIHRVNFNGFYTDSIEEECKSSRISISNITIK